MTFPRLVAFLLFALALAAPASRAADAPRHVEGHLASGATYVVDVPATWNGTLLLYSHGYARGPDNPARNAPDTGDVNGLLEQGYALAGSSYARTGWAIEQAVPDQLATLDAFAERFGKPRRTLAWGSSMGGLVTIALMEQHPARFQGGLAICASASGTLGMMNAALDGAFVFSQLAAPELPVLMTQAGAEAGKARAAWQAAVDAAQRTPEGRARIGLAAAVAQVPLPQDNIASADTPLADVQTALYRGLLPATLMPRDDQTERAGGGNFSWNDGIDYAAQLQTSGRARSVRALYKEAGLSLDDDLARLANAPRLKADAPAADYMARHYLPSGQLQAPLLLVQTTADPVTLVELSGDYPRTARAAGRGDMARGAYIRRTGHCNFKPAEVDAALAVLNRRVDTGAWAALPQALNQRAADAPFVDFEPAPFVRACSTAACPGRPTR